MLTTKFLNTQNLANFFEQYDIRRLPENGLDSETATLKYYLEQAEKLVTNNGEGEFVLCIDQNKRIGLCFNSEYTKTEKEGEDEELITLTIDFSDKIRRF